VTPMHARIFLIALCQVAAAAAWPGNAGATEPTGYSITGRVPGSGGAWDYAVVDEHSGRLFLAQAGVTALDLKTNTVTTDLVPGKMTHALAPLGTEPSPSMTARTESSRSLTGQAVEFYRRFPRQTTTP